MKNKIAFGESRHKDKQELDFGKSSYKIYSYQTYKTYLKENLQYAKWLKQEKGISRIDDLSKTEEYAKEYIQNRLDSGVSVYTAKMERSALGMLYNKQIDIEMPVRDNKAITRSRNETKNDKHYSRNGKYKDIFIIGLATGGRRKDLAKLTVNNFKEINGNLYVSFEQSKGGRNRLSPVRLDYVKQVKEIIEQAKKDGKSRLFDKIPDKIDIHGLRREYAQNLYNDFAKNREFRDDYLKICGYPVRKEIKYYKDKDGNTHTREIKKDTYKDRNGNTYNRNDLFAVSQALGHSRLQVSVCHYTKH